MHYIAEKQHRCSKKSGEQVAKYKKFVHESWYICIVSSVGRREDTKHCEETRTYIQNPCIEG